MRTGRPKALLTMSSDERAHLLAITRSRSLPAALTLRANIVLACERDPSNAVVATRLGVGPHTIGKWRNRLITDRIEGVYDEMRSGRSLAAEDEAEDEVDSPRQAPRSLSGVSRVPASHRGQCARPARRPSRRRQLCHAQASQGQSLARTPSALAHSLHISLCLLVEPVRTLLRPHHSTRYPSRLV